MEIIKKDSCLILKPSVDFGGKQMITISDFFNEFSVNLSNFKNDNLIIDFSKIIDADLNEILLFSQISKEQKNNNRSFVLVYKGVDVDKLPDDLIAVPTLKEAEDIIEMENIERDLGI